jgi:hypothetical protein
LEIGFRAWRDAAWLALTACISPMVDGSNARLNYARRRYRSATSSRKFQSAFGLTVIAAPRRVRRYSQGACQRKR